MNERIRELAAQAARLSREEHPEIAKGVTLNDILGRTDRRVCVVDDVTTQKLAELIIKECLDEIESKRLSGENTDSWTITRDLCYLQMIQEIKQHFGIEE
jgi:nickel-dependent lactate racemase